MKDEKDSCGVSYRAKWIEAEMIINAIGEALDGEEQSDFELSYPIVRKAFDLYVTLNKEIVFYKERFNTRFAEGFKKGQNSVLRKNKSGCCCIITDDGEVLSVCGAHEEWVESLPHPTKSAPVVEENVGKSKAR